MTEPCDLSAVQARRLIGQGRLSPVDLLESCIARIESVDHALNAVVARDFDRARDAAHEAEARAKPPRNSPARSANTSATCRSVGAKPKSGDRAARRRDRSTSAGRAWCSGRRTARPCTV